MLLYRSLGVRPRRTSRPSSDDRELPEAPPETERPRAETPPPVANRATDDRR